MEKLKSFMWIQNPNTSLPDIFIVNGEMIDNSEFEIRKNASHLQMLEISPNIIERILTSQYNKKNRTNIEMRSHLTKGTIYLSKFSKKISTNRTINFFYWCARSELYHLDRLLQHDAVLMSETINLTELQFVRKTTKFILIYQIVVLLLFILIILILLILL